MNKAIIVAVVLIVLAGAAFVLTQGDNSDEQNNSTDAVSDTQTEGEETSSSSADSGNEFDPNGYAASATIGETVDATDQTEVSISAGDFIFDPTYLKIKKGTKVTWTNDGNIGHTVTSADSSPNKGLDSELLGNGESYEFTFAETGLYEYFCVPHPTQMRGVITVVD